jgi:hypothetical protein
MIEFYFVSGYKDRRLSRHACMDFVHALADSLKNDNVPKAAISHPRYDSVGSVFRFEISGSRTLSSESLRKLREDYKIIQLHLPFSVLE